MKRIAQRKGEAGTQPASFEPEDASVQSPETLDLAMLRRRWRSLIGRAAPPHLPRSLLIRVIAYRQQVQLGGDLDRTTLKAIAAATETGSAGTSEISVVSQFEIWKG